MVQCAHAWLTSSPSFRLAVPHACATRLTASLALRVKTISLQLSALTNDATYKTLVMLAVAPQLMLPPSSLRRKYLICFRS